MTARELQGARRAEPGRRAGPDSRAAGAPGRHGHARSTCAAPSSSRCSLLIDGVPVDEPYFGIFDVSAIPDHRHRRDPRAALARLAARRAGRRRRHRRGVHAARHRRPRIDARVVGGSTPDGEGGGHRAHAAHAARSGMRASAGARFADPSYPSSRPTGCRRRTSSIASAGQRRAAARVRDRARPLHRRRLVRPSRVLHSAVGHHGRRAAGRHVEDAARAGARRRHSARHGMRIALGAYGELLQRTTDFYSDYTLRPRGAATRICSPAASAPPRTSIARSAARPARHRSRRGSPSTAKAPARSRRPAPSADLGQFSTYGELARRRQAALALAARSRRRSAALVPFENPTATWPEAKVVVGVQPQPMIELLLIGARKGRLPTLRELYDPQQGNAKLSPEQTWHGELRGARAPAPAHRGAPVAATCASIDGLIRLDSHRPMRRTSTSTPSTCAASRPASTWRASASSAAASPTSSRTPTRPIAGAALQRHPQLPAPPRRRLSLVDVAAAHRRAGALSLGLGAPGAASGAAALQRHGARRVGRASGRPLRGSVRIDNLTNNTYQILPGLNALPITVTATVEGTWP